MSTMKYVYSRISYDYTKETQYFCALFLWKEFLKWILTQKI